MPANHKRRLGAAFLLACFSLTGLTAQAAPRKIRMVMVASPGKAIRGAVREMSEELQKRTKGKLAIEVEWSVEQKDNFTSTFPRKVAAGEYDMAFMLIGELGELNKSFQVFRVPFLFKSHDHLERVVDGPIGREILDGLLPHKLRGLALTYQGGLEILTTHGKPIRKPGDFKNLRIGTYGGAVDQIWAKRFGAQLVRSGVCCREVRPFLLENKLDAIATVYENYFAYAPINGEYPLHNVINVLDMTAELGIILVNEDFFQKLPPEERNALAEITESRIREERRRIRLSNAAIKQELKMQGGTTVVELTKRQRADFRAFAETSYPEMAEVVGSSLLEKVGKASR